MKTEKIEGRVSTVLGEQLDKPIDFAVEYEAFSTVAELKEAGEFPNDADILSYVNGKRAMNARQKEVAKLTKEISESIAETPEYKLRSLVKDIRQKNPKLTEEKARAAAESILALE